MDTRTQEEEVVETAEPEEEVAELKPDSELEKVEARARKLGWAPEEEWRGAKEDWVPAHEFLDRVAANPAIFNERFEQLEQRHTAEVGEISKRLTEATRILGEVHQANKTITKRFDAADQNAVERARRHFEQEMETAVEESDKERHRKAKQALADLEPRPAAAKEAEPEPEPVKPEPAPPNPIAAKWVANNDWFEKDFVLPQAAEALHIEINKTG